MKKTWLILIITAAIILGLVNFILSSKIKKETNQGQVLPQTEQEFLQKEVSKPPTKESLPVTEEGKKEKGEPLKGPQPN